MKKTESADISKPLRNSEARRQTYDLDELIDGITPENRHYEIDFGKPMGKEAL